VKTTLLIRNPQAWGLPPRNWRTRLIFAAALAAWTSLNSPAFARNQLRQAFFQNYPSALGTVLDSVPSRSGHCGVCHFKFSGGGARNPYGLAVQANLGQGNSNAVWTVRGEDSDGDGIANLVEITDTSVYANTPTFPGYVDTAGITEVALADIAGHLVPVTGGDNKPPDISVLTPNGGETLVANQFTQITWTATDSSGVTAVNLFVSLDNGATYQQIARDLDNSGTFAWVPADRPSAKHARIKATARDTYGNSGSDVSDETFTIASPPFTNVHGVTTTLRDFDMPGTQPFEHGPELSASATCAACHGGYDPAIEPHFNWQGGMMANASRDLLFLANLTLANQDAANSGDLCLRCHLPRGWLGGRSVPTDGSRMVGADQDGVTCALCHAMVDPVYATGTSPTNDLAVLAGLSFPGTDHGNGMYVVDPSGVRRGPYSDAVLGHDSLGSPFHRSAAFCGTCHDVSNPVFDRDAQGVYQPNALDTPAAVFSPHFLAPVERTYSEWLHSDYAADEGVYAPAFAGNRPGGRVSTCQNCHMPYASGYIANPDSNPGIPPRMDMAVHDLTGGSTWMPAMLTRLYPDEVNPQAIMAAIDRSERLLAKAASLAVADADNQLKVTVTNETGHKLPTGYPEGRRVWLNVKFYDENTMLTAESGAYDFDTGELRRDASAKIYEVHPGIDTNISGLLGLDAAASLHFVLNNKIYEDNRIPPRGFANAAFAAFGGEPVGHHYDDGQYWDDTLYPLPDGTVRAEVKLYYQSTSKEFVEFLRDHNHSDTRGQELFQLWNNHGKCPPTLMQEATWLVAFRLQSCGLNANGDFELTFHCRPGLNYTVEHTDSLQATPHWHSITHVPIQTPTTLVDPTISATGMRFYRVSYSVTR
jgi:hypothetical protein